ncbi:hypothetical protein [Microbispora sp. H10885]|uniref:hypothetical protein n=1 Tax=Microbispora sp. H10885 TaxID=2729110 RepID=UPI001602CFD1|nr:hypothetical protein [Microbispora sp. H10885]
MRSSIALEDDPHLQQLLGQVQAPAKLRSSIASKGERHASIVYDDLAAQGLRSSVALRATATGGGLAAGGIVLGVAILGRLVGRPPRVIDTATGLPVTPLRSSIASKGERHASIVYDDLAAQGLRSSVAL